MRLCGTTATTPAICRNRRFLPHTKKESQKYIAPLADAVYENASLVEKKTRISPALTSTTGTNYRIVRGFKKPARLYSCVWKIGKKSVCLSSQARYAQSTPRGIDHMHLFNSVAARRIIAAFAAIMVVSVTLLACIPTPAVYGARDPLGDEDGTFVDMAPDVSAQESVAICLDHDRRVRARLGLGDDAGTVTPVRYGWYADRAVRYGTSFFTTPSGGEVQVTLVSWGFVPRGGYGPDAGPVYCRGPVVRYVRGGQENVYETYKIVPALIEIDWNRYKD